MRGSVYTVYRKCLQTGSICKHQKVPLEPVKLYYSIYVYNVYIIYYRLIKRHIRGTKCTLSLPNTENIETWKNM